MRVENNRFDRRTKTLSQSRSRRSLLSALFGGAVALNMRQRSSAQVSTPGGMCGGLAAIPCPEGFACVDDPNDDCDPATGGADCSGVCLPTDVNPCAAILCIEGSSCCPQCGGICVPDNVPCNEDLCLSEPCNQSMCGPGEYCCNESCGICAPLGGGCIEVYCEPPGEPGVPCGPTICAPGQVCCNESCGICTPPDGVCIMIACLD